MVPMPMSSRVPSVAPSRMRRGVDPLRVAFLGSLAWLDACCPPAPAHGLVPGRIEIGAPAIEDIRAFNPHVTVVLDPADMTTGILAELPGITLGVLVAAAPDEAGARAVGSLDRLVSFRPDLTGARVGAKRIWRAIPPPVNDAMFGEVRPLHGRPRAMAVGRSTAHRERMLTPAKHHHDLLHVIHGVSGASLLELLSEYDVGVYAAPEPEGGFGHQVGMHLAAGHLLLAEALVPAHGLERDIDYLQVDSAEGLVWALDRLGRFPEMHQRIRVRGRLKAEQYRASRLFGRIVHDVMADVSAFGV